MIEVCGKPALNTAFRTSQTSSILTWIQKMRARCAVDCVLIIVIGISWRRFVRLKSNDWLGWRSDNKLATTGSKSKNEKEFFKGLAELMDMAKDSLETKRKVLERLTDANLYPYTKVLFAKH